jgi:CRP-like cAMP-binding protein
MRGVAYTHLKTLAPRPRLVDSPQFCTPTQQPNALLSAMPPGVVAHLLAQSSQVRLRVGAALFEAGQAYRTMYFPLLGLVGIQTADAAGNSLEVGLVGREGMLGSHLLLGVARSAQTAHVISEGMAWAVDVSHLEELMGLAGVRSVLLGYVATQMNDVMQRVACVHRHEIEPRLANWLCMASAKTAPAGLFATHEHIGSLLGSTRAGVTHAACNLLDAGLIWYRRGEIRIVDPVGLRQRACGCNLAAINCSGSGAAVPS